MALYEVFSVDEQVRRVIIDGADSDQIRKHAAATGMMSLRECGLRHVRAGLTTVEEVMQVVADQM